MAVLLNNEILLSLKRSETIYNKVSELSKYIFYGDGLSDRDAHMKELEYLLRGIKGTDAHLTIFNHKTFAPELEVGHIEFWGPLPDGTMEERMISILALLNKEYRQFPYESVAWFTKELSEVPFDERVNMKIHHSGMRFSRMDGLPICIFSQGMPIQIDAERNFNYTLNYVQNINHLIKKDFPYYWIRFAYGQQKQYVRTFHSNDKLHSKNDLLSAREKEILKLVAEDLETKEIAQRLFISVNTVGNHRSNMIERLGARDTTALVQLAKIAGII
ncbi:MAG: response regulator transcription factor [Saprospiraceae bacterium]|nr:response regulator transcription factor [Saprospiraceae bacterium]